jgi:hypothetical protein
MRNTRGRVNYWENPLRGNKIWVISVVVNISKIQYAILYQLCCRASHGITGHPRVPEVPWEIACNPGKAWITK